MTESQKTPLLLAMSLFFLAILNIFILPPGLSSDSGTYLETMNVLETGARPAEFVPNRILTNYLSMRAILVIEKITGNIFVAWMTLNISLFIACGLIFYFILRDFLKDKKGVPAGEKTAIAGVMLLATNYAMLGMGLNYLVDIGGWMFYVLSLYFVFKFLESEENEKLYQASAIVGLGLFFKEYAVLGYIAIFFAILYKNRSDKKDMAKKIILTGIISFIPLLLLHIKVYFDYGYSYLNWFQYNETKYGAHYPSRVIEYIKSLGSLYNIGWIFFVGGIYQLARYKNDFLDKDRQVFLVIVALSALPAFVWPAITQRILFITIPFAILVSTIFIWRYEKKIAFFIPPIILYILASYTMDSYILPMVNIDALISGIKNIF